VRAASIVVALAIVWCADVAHAQPRGLAASQLARGPLEDQPPYIDLLTFGVGDKLFEKFGHAAICVRYHDPKHLPICFNFGVTDFNAGPIMIWSFVRGEQDFWVEASTYGEMFRFYKWEDRDIWLQTLPVTGEQARALERQLWASLEGAHRTYQYDHFFNNCTTRLRDMIDGATGGKLAIGGDERYPLTFRQLGYRGLAELPPLQVFADFAMGRQLEDYPSVWQAMFHPEVFRREIERRLGVAPRLVYKRQGAAFAVTGSTGRLTMLAIALLFALPLLAARWKGLVPRLAIGAAYTGLLVFTLFEVMPSLWAGLGAGSLVVPFVGVAGFAMALHPARGETAAVIWAMLHLAFWGFVVYGLVVLSSIEGVRWNEAVLVVMPFDVVLPFLGAPKRRRYAQGRVALVVLGSLLCAIGVFRQPLWIPILAVFVPMAIIAFDLPNSLLRLARKVEAVPKPPEAPVVAEVAVSAGGEAARDPS